MSTEKVAVARGLGADHVIDYQAGDFVEEVKRLTGGRGADVIYDPVGGEVFERSTKCIAFEGRLLVIGFTYGKFGEVRANHVLIKNYAVVGLHWGFYVQRGDPLVDECQDDLHRLYDAGKIKPLVSRALPLAEARTALADVASRRSTGKIVLTP